MPEPTGTGAEERLKGLPQIRVCEHGYQITEMNGRWVHHLDARLNNGRGGELCGAPEGAYEIVDVAPASDLAALQERLEEMKSALDGEWYRNHADTCTNMDDCESFGGKGRCHYPRPSALEGQ